MLSYERVQVPRYSEDSQVSCKVRSYRRGNLPCSNFLQPSMQQVLHSFVQPPLTSISPPRTAPPTARWSEEWTVNIPRESEDPRRSRQSTDLLTFRRCVCVARRYTYKLFSRARGGRGTKLINSPPPHHVQSENRTAGVILHLCVLIETEGECHRAKLRR